MARKRKFNEAQIIGFLKQVDAGAKVGDVCREHGFSEHSYYRWKAKYGGLDVSQAQEKRRLEEENRRLKHIVADQALDIATLKAVLGKKW
jgi:putative transposase